MNTVKHLAESRIVNGLRNTEKLFRGRLVGSWLNPDTIVTML